MLQAPKTKSFDPVPKGNHVARLYQIIHIGTVPTTWQGETKMTDKVRLTFELSNERKVFKKGDEAKPYSVSREFTFSMGKKASLRSFVEGFGGTALHDDEAYNFDLEKLLGEACLLNVVHTERDGNTYANIAGASPLPKGMDAPTLVNEAKLIDVNSTPFEEINALAPLAGAFSLLPKRNPRQENRRGFLPRSIRPAAAAGLPRCGGVASASVCVGRVDADCCVCIPIRRAAGVVPIEMHFAIFTGRSHWDASHTVRALLDAGAFKAH
jgi:hypothetical protein